jgi:hypothetical protein
MQIQCRMHQVSQLIQYDVSEFRKPVRLDRTSLRRVSFGPKTETTVLTHKFKLEHHTHWQVVVSTKK